MDKLLNIIRRECERVMSRRASPMVGIVTSYDPAQYAAKVLLQPTGQETGFIPVRTPWSGDGWGMFCPPSVGDEVEIGFQEGGKQAPYIRLRAYGDRFRPLPCPSGEFWLVDKLGNSFKFSGGKVLLNGNTEIDVAAPTLTITSSIAVNVTTPVMTLAGNLIVYGSIRATGDIIDNDGTNENNMANFRAIYDAHVHRDTYSGNTTPPLAPDIL